MRGLVLLTALSVTLVHAAWNGYVGERNPDPPTHGIDGLHVDSGTGDLSAGSASVRYAALRNVDDEIE